MIGDKRLLAIIPARAGSKRLPGKNIIDFAGKPMISWSIEAALASKYIDNVIVSTEDNNIAKISKRFGAEVPFLRPKELATDEANSVDVIISVLDNLKLRNIFYDYIILLQPTSPLRGVRDINKSIELMLFKECASVVSVCKVNHNPLWINTLPGDDSMVNFIDNYFLNKSSQDLPHYYKLNGAIYLCDSKRLRDEKSLFIKESCFAFKMNFSHSIDIDSKDDLHLANSFLDKYNS